MNDYTPEFLERVKRDYQAEQSQLDWESYLAGYWSAVKRFGSGRKPRQSDRETRSKLSYSRIGRNNV